MTRPQTFILSHSQIASILTQELAVEAVHGVMEAHGRNKVVTPNLLHSDVPRGEFNIKTGGVLRGGEEGVFGLKANGGFFGNHELGLPNIVGVIYLADARTGCPLAVLDSVEISRLRTGAASAVAARYLARKNSEVMTVLGTGTQAYTQTQLLSKELPIKRVRLVGRNMDRTKERAAFFEKSLSLEVEPYSSVQRALVGSDVLVTCTPARGPMILKSYVSPGMFIAAVGADSPGKQELDPSLVASSKTIADVHSQCIKVGELQHPIKEGLMSADDVYGELGEVICGSRAGRSSEEEITIYDSTGTALQDVAVGCIVYERARAAGVGLSVQLAD